MADPSLLTLAHNETAAIEALWLKLRALPAKSRVLEQHVESEALTEALAALLGQPAWIVTSLLEAILAERGSFEPMVDMPEAPATPSEVATEDPPADRIEFRPAKRDGTMSPQLVWSGDTGHRSCARLTRETIEDLFAAVEGQVLIAGYSFDHASDLFEPLFRKAHALEAQGRAAPKVRVVLDCSRKASEGGESPETLARKVCEDFLRTCWRQGPIEPEIRYLRASAERTGNGFARFSMHAKCIIVDRTQALVGSANFSNRGRDRNLEVGAVIRDYHFVQSLCAEWEALWPSLVQVSR